MKHNKFEKLRGKMPKEAQNLAEIGAESILANMNLSELRQARELNQEIVAKMMDTKQANISRIERREDMHISTLREYISAIGGDLEIFARFPEGTIHITQFD